MAPSDVKVIFRDLDVDVVRAVDAEAPPGWDVAFGDIFDGAPADFIVSPANCIGRMDGGIDLVYVHRFGWQLEARLMRDIKMLYGGKLPIGQAHMITTYGEDIPMMISAPTMDWPPGNVSYTDNAYRSGQLG